MILKLYKQLENVTLKDFPDIVASTEIIYSYTLRARKLRIWLIDTSYIDIWYSLDGKYSFHWEIGLGKIYRHDNAPHNKWANIGTFPKHCHDDLQDNVIESHLPNQPQEALKEFLSAVRNKLLDKRLEK